MLDPIEKAEISAENAFFAMSQPDGKLKCGCGQVFDPDKEGGTVSPDPYAMPVCNRCLEEFDSHIKINQLQAESLAKDAQIVALRMALTDTLAIARIKWGNLDADANAVMTKADCALSAPPPPVVPLEDVRPLLAAIMDATRLTMCPTSAEANLISATRAFIAKYPTP